MYDFIIPKVGMGITEVIITEWRVKIGDTVTRGDPIVEIDAEKGNVVLQSEVSGVVAEICCKKDEQVEIGSVICRIREG